MTHHDDLIGTAADPLVWSAGGAHTKRRWLVRAWRNFAMLPGPALIWASDWVSFLPAAVSVKSTSPLEKNGYENGYENCTYTATTST